MSFDIVSIKKAHDDLRKKLITKLDGTSDYLYPETEDFWVTCKLITEPNLTILKEICEYTCAKADCDYDGNWDSMQLFNFLSKKIERYGKGEMLSFSESFGGLSPVLALLSYLSSCSIFTHIEGSFTHDKWEARGDYYAPKRVGLRLVNGKISVGVFDTDSSSDSYLKLISIAVVDSELDDMFQDAIDTYGEILTAKVFLGGIRVYNNCITVTAPLEEIDPNGKYSIHRLEPELYYGVDALPEDSRKARTLENLIKAFELINYKESGLSKKAVIEAISNAFENEKVIVRVYFSSASSDVVADFSHKELIPWNIELNRDNILVKYTERAKDAGVLTCPKCMHGIDPKVLASLKATKTIVVRGYCKLTQGMFEGVDCIEEVDLYDLNAEVIPANAFKNCHALKHVIIPESVYKIESGAFENCVNLSVVTLSESVAYISESAFKNCDNLKGDIKEKISEILKDPTRFDRMVADSVEYIQTHGLCSYSFDESSPYSPYRRLFNTRKEYEKWHSLYDEYFDNLERLTKGKFRFVTWPSLSGPLYPNQIQELAWKQTKEISAVTDYLFVDTKCIPNFDRFIQKQRKIDEGDLQGASVFGNNPLEKAINLKKSGGKIKIVELDLFFRLLEEGNFEEIIVEDRTEEIKAKREAEKAAKKENKESQCEDLIASIVGKSKEQGILFTNAEIVSIIEESEVPLRRLEKYVSDKHEKTLKEFFEDLGVLKTVKTEFYALVALLNERYKNKAKVSDVTALIADNADLDLSIVANNSKRFTGLSTREYLISEGILAGADEKTTSALTEGVLFKPGEEPADIKKRIDTLFEKLDGAYPDKVIVGLHKEHKKWGETVTDLYRKLGYKSGADFLTAYGYKMSDDKGGRPKVDYSILIDAIKNRYPNGAEFKTAIEFLEANADLPNLNTFKTDAPSIVGMTFGKWLKSIGLMGK